MLGLSLCLLCPLHLSGVHSGADCKMSERASRCVSRLVLVPMFCFRDQSANQHPTQRRHRSRGANSWLRASTQYHNKQGSTRHNIFKMASMNFSSGKQFVKPPQRGIFPLDHDAECKPKMQVSSMVVWRCIPVREKDDVNLESDEVLLRCAG